MTKRVLRIWIAAGLAVLAGCGSSPQVQVEVSQLNPLQVGDKVVYRAVRAKLYLLPADAVAAFEGATTKQLWPDPGGSVEIPGAKLVFDETLEPTSSEKSLVLNTEEGKYTHLGVTANYPDPSAVWVRSFKIDEVKGRAIRFHRSAIDAVDKGADTPADDGR